MPNVIQRVQVSIGGQTIETSTMSIFDLTQLAQKYPKTPGAEAIYKAIMAGDVKQEVDDGEDEDDGPPPEVDLSFVVALQAEEPDEVDTPSVDLLSRGEIIKIHKRVKDVAVKGFRYDNLTHAIASARAQVSITDKMAQLVWGIVRGHTFNDGNKRTGQIMLDEMMQKNHKYMHKTGLLELLRQAADASSGLTEAQFRDGITNILTAPVYKNLPLGHAIL